MSVRHAAQPQFPLRGLREGPAAPWVRPADWPGLPWILDSEQALVGLLAVLDTSNEAVQVQAQGAFTVDWGDGTVQDYASNAQAAHTYNYATLDTLVTSRGYKTAIVKVTPQAGQNLTFISLYQRPSSFHPGPASSTPWLDVQINAANATSIQVGGEGALHSRIERLHIRKHACTNMDALCMRLYSLMDLPLFDASGLTSAVGFMRYAYALRVIPPLDFSSVVNATDLARECSALTDLPVLDLSSATAITALFYNNQSLYYVPGIVFGPNPAATHMFYGCSSLRVIGALDLSNFTSFTEWFTACTSLVRSMVTGVKVTHSYANCSLSATALNEIFTNLASGVTGQTITVTGNPGAATCDTSIATAKGWTVVT